MKLNSNFLTHQSQEEYYMISTSNAKFNGIIKNNETANFIIECLKMDITESGIVDRILKEYEVEDKAKVENDVKKVINTLREIGALDE